MSWRFLLSLPVSFLFNIIVNLLSVVLQDTYFHFSAQSLLCWILARKVDRQGKICGNKKTSKITHCDWPALQFNFFINHNQSRTHSRPQRSRSFWSAPRMATSDQTQFSKHAQSIRFIFSVNQIWQNWGEVRESHTSNVGPAQKSRFWPKRVWPLGTKMSRTLNHRSLLGMRDSFPDRCSRGTKTLWYEGVI